MKVHQRCIFVGVAVIVVCVCLDAVGSWGGSRELWEGMSEALDSMIEERDCFDEDKLSGASNGAQCRSRTQERMSRFQEEVRRRQEAKQAKQQQEENERERQRQAVRLNQLQEERPSVSIPNWSSPVPAVPDASQERRVNTDRNQHNPSNEAARCIAIDNSNRRLYGVRFVNTCSYSVEITWCANTKRDPRNCDAGYDSTTGIAPGGSWPIASLDKALSWEYGACKKGTMFGTSEMSGRKEYRCIDR
jgi:hypothetical protein